VGSLKPRKNLPILLEAFERILVQVPQACLILIGRGPDEAALRSQVDRLGIEHAVVFAGFVTEQEKLAYYSVTNLFVSPSLMEGFGLAVGEAMACGLPVVATRAGSLPEVVNDGKTGLLVPASDVGALSGSILRLLQDGALAHQMGQAGQARVERLFRWETSARRTLEFYGEML
jgi:glycosyltransferase involved in cell wall biosynthesis